MIPSMRKLRYLRGAQSVFLRQYLFRRDSKLYSSYLQLFPTAVWAYIPQVESGRLGIKNRKILICRTKTYLTFDFEGFGNSVLFRKAEIWLRVPLSEATFSLEVWSVFDGGQASNILVYWSLSTISSLNSTSCLIPQRSFLRDLREVLGSSWSLKFCN